MADYEGIAGTGPTSGVIFVPENIPHYYDEQGVLKVVAVGYDSQGRIPAGDPAPENQGENYHRAKTPPGPTPTGQVLFDWFGRCTEPGIGDDGVYAVGDFKGHPSGAKPGDPTKKAGLLTALVLAAEAYAKA